MQTKTNAEIKEKVVGLLRDYVNGMVHMDEYGEVVNYTYFSSRALNSLATEIIETVQQSTSDE